MQWDGSPNAGFTIPDVEPWLPISDDFRQFNVEAMSADPDSIWSLHRELLRLRRETPALTRGQYQPLEAHEDIFAYIRKHGGQRRLVALNFAGEGRSYRIPGADRGQILLSTHLDREEPVMLEHLMLRPYEGVIVDLDG
jgi:alpha-glucosidase